MQLSIDNWSFIFKFVFKEISYLLNILSHIPEFTKYYNLNYKYNKYYKSKKTSYYFHCIYFFRIGLIIFET